MTEIRTPDLSKFDPRKAHYIISTVAIIKDGRFLITKRAPHEKVFPNKWTLPGGKLEMDDYIHMPTDGKYQWYNIMEHSLRRESLEEVGLDIKNIRYLTSLVFIRPDGIPVVVLSMYADYVGGEVQLSEDMTEFAWVTAEDAKNYDFIEGIYEELVMLDRILKDENPGEWKKEI